MPGNCIMTSLSLVTETPPSCVQKRWCAAISVTLRCTCPMAAPVLLGEASCAGRGAAAITARARRIRMLIGAYYIRLREKSNGGELPLSRLGLWQRGPLPHGCGSVERGSPRQLVPHHL